MKLQYLHIIGANAEVNVFTATSLILDYNVEMNIHDEIDI